MTLEAVCRLGKDLGGLLNKQSLVSTNYKVSTVWHQVAQFATVPMELMNFNERSDLGDQIGKGQRA